MSSIVDERRATHGDPRSNMARIASAWSGILGFEVDAKEAALCMAALHFVRETSAPVSDPEHLRHADGYLEIAHMIKDNIDQPDVPRRTVE